MGQLYNLYILACEHSVASLTTIRNQYPADEHYIYCPSCREATTPPPLCWQKVVIVREPQPLSELPSGISFVMSNEILRLQPTVSPSRVRPFPYVSDRRRS